MSNWHWQEGEYEVVRTCTWSPSGEHPVEWSLLLYIKDGKLHHVEGGPKNPLTQGRVSAKFLELPEYNNSPERIIYPMKRDPKYRGDGAQGIRCARGHAFAVSRRGKVENHTMLPPSTGHERPLGDSVQRVLGSRLVIRAKSTSARSLRRTAPCLRGATPKRPWPRVRRRLSRWAQVRLAWLIPTSDRLYETACECKPGCSWALRGEAILRRSFSVRRGTHARVWWA
jgi:hypothetical protein